MSLTNHELAQSALKSRTAMQAMKGNVRIFVFEALKDLSTVQKWQISQQKPTGTALKLFHLVQQRGLDTVAECGRGIEWLHYGDPYQVAHRDGCAACPSGRAEDVPSKALLN